MLNNKIGFQENNKTTKYDNGDNLQKKLLS